MTIEQVKQHLLSREKPRASILAALSGLNREETAEIGAIWPSIPQARRALIVRALVELSEDSPELYFAPLFRLALADPDPVVRSGGIEGLWEDNSLDLIPIFERFLRDDPDERVRTQAAIALGRYAAEAELDEIDEATGAHVRDALKGSFTNSAETIEVRRRALEAASSFADDQAVMKAIAEAYQSPVREMRVSAVFAMGRGMHERWLETVIRELSSPDPAIRFEAARASGEYGDAVALPGLVRLLADEREIALQAIWALGQIGSEEALQALRTCAQSNDPVVQEAAEDALAEAALMSGSTDGLFL